MSTAFTTLYEVLAVGGGSVLLSTPGTETTSGYETITWSPPGRPKRRLVEQSAYVDGEVETASVLDAAKLQWHVRIRGLSYADLQANYEDLITAIEDGPGMGFRVTIDGYAREWECTGAASITPRSEGQEGDALRWSLREEWVVEWSVIPS